MIPDAIVSAILNLIILVGIPFGGYVVFHLWRHKRPFSEIAHRAGLRLGHPRYLAYCAAFAIVTVGFLIAFPPSVEEITREGSSQNKFAGLGLNGTTITMALLYGVVATGFCEELLFRGLIAGSLSRRMPMRWANLIQAVIFLAPHMLLLLIMPELWWILPIIFVGSLFLGWARIRSGSILGPWLVHASANVTTALTVAMRS